MDLFVGKWDLSLENWFFDINNKLIMYEKLNVVKGNNLYV